MSNKTTAGAATIGAALSILAVYVEGLFGLSIPPEVAAAEATVFTAAFGAIFPR